MGPVLTVFLVGLLGLLGTLLVIVGVGIYLLIRAIGAMRNTQ